MFVLHSPYCIVYHKLYQPRNSKSYSVHNQTSKMELFAKVVNSFQPLTIFAKNSILDFFTGL